MDSKPLVPPRRTAIELAWGRDDRPRRGPRPSLKLQEIVGAAVDIADESGVEALSMKRVADRVGVTPMALYRYVGSKDDLVFLAVDAVAATAPHPPGTNEHWRAAVERWARSDLAVLTAHPWIVRVPMSEPPLGPNQLTWLDRLLASLAGSGLPAADRLGVATLIAGYVMGHFRQYEDLTHGARSRGLTREEGERRYFETAQQVVDASRIPNVAEAFAAIGSGQATTAQSDFEFGLARILDGVEAMARQRGG
jgi:AcrR family transcriptional regulator